MTDRGVGVADTAAGAGIAEVRVRERTIGGNTYAEQVVMPVRERVTTSIICYSVVGTVLASAHTTTNAFWFLVNHVSSGITICLRRINFTSQHNTALATPTGPRIVLRRITFTGTPSGATATGARAVAANAPSANWSLRTAVTGMTPANVADVFGFFPVAAVTAVGACAPAYQDWNPEDEGMVVLAAGEGVALYQADAGTTSDTRRFVANLSVEEYTTP